MSDPDILQRQRAILRNFRAANAQRSSDEAKAAQALKAAQEVVDHTYRR